MVPEKNCPVAIVVFGLVTLIAEILILLTWEISNTIFG